MTQELNKSFSDYDLLGLEFFAKSLKNHAIGEYPYVDGSLVISLNGSFGSGKDMFSRNVPELP